MIKFELPDIQSKTVSVNTLKIYNSRLNKLAKAGFPDIQAIQTNPQGVIEAVNTLFPGTDPSPSHERNSTCRCEQCKLREIKRYFYTAIFYALADTKFIKSPNPLYEEFQKQKQNYNSH